MEAKYKKINKLCSVDKAYLAGLVDGEGTITLGYKQKKAQRHLEISISNTDYELLDWVIKCVGVGKITSKVVHNKKTFSSVCI